jgi:hypothetical protein
VRLPNPQRQLRGNATNVLNLRAILIFQGCDSRTTVKAIHQGPGDSRDHARFPDTAIPAPSIRLPLLLFLLRINRVPVIPICFRNRFLALAPIVAGRFLTALSLRSVCIWRALVLRLALPFSAATSFFSAATFLGPALVFLSSLAIVSPTVDLMDFLWRVAMGPKTGRRLRQFALNNRDQLAFTSGMTFPRSRSSSR